MKKKTFVTGDMHGEYVSELTMKEYIMHNYGHLHLDTELPSIKQRVLWFDHVESM